MIDMNVFGFLMCVGGRWLNFLILGNVMLICVWLFVWCVLIICGRWCRVCGLNMRLMYGVCDMIDVFFWFVM